MKFLKAADALKHSNWSMGDKVTIDCATFMNKGYEVMEAHWLFNISYEQIDVLIHKESTVHSMVEFVDGSIIAQLGVLDMWLPIQYALQHSAKLSNEIPKLEFTKLHALHFEKPNLEKFACLGYAYEAGKWGNTTRLGITGPTAAPKEEQFFEPTFRVGNGISGYTEDPTTNPVIA